jgi:type I restriction enzyme S subunit
MSPERLLKYFEQICEAPDAVTHLRKFILDLAVRGKLVEQNSGDEPAVELLKRIEAEKARLVEAGVSKRQTQLPPIKEMEIPFEIPENWNWVRLIDLLTKLTDGTHHSPPNFDQGDYKYITAKNIKLGGVSLEEVSFVTKEVHNEIYNRCDPKKGDILYIKDGATTGVAAINDLNEPFSMLSSVALLKVPECVYNRLLVFFLQSPFFYEQMRGFMKGAAITRVTLKRMAPALIPLPPLAEQHRIVAKMDELMALCDKLEVTQAKREKRRDRLVAATLNGLNNGDASPAPGTRPAFKDSARFYLNHLPRLTTRPEHIHQLRQTILNLAIRGKLVAQDDRDEAVGLLISQIQTERAQRSKIGEPINSEIFVKSAEGRFLIPPSWKWVRLGFATNVIMGQSPPGVTYNTHREGMPLINGPVEFTEGAFGITALNQYTTAPTKRCEKGDLLLCVRGSTTGRTNIAGFDACIGRGVAALQPLYADKFIRLFVWASREQIIEMGRGIAFPSVSRQQIEEFPTPLPPLAEQYRIVARVDELMALCVELENKLFSSASRYRKLTEAALYNALSS